MRAVFILHKSLPPGCGPYPEDYETMIKAYPAQDLRCPDSLKDFKIIKAPEVVVLEIRIPPLALKKGFEVWEAFICL